MLVVGLVGLLIIKAGIALVPVYWDDRMLNTVLKKTQETPEYSGLNAKELVSLVEGLLQRNNLEIPTDDLEVKLNSSQTLELNWPYERRANWIGNIDLVVKFQHQKEFN